MIEHTLIIWFYFIENNNNSLTLLFNSILYINMYTCIMRNIMQYFNWNWMPKYKLANGVKYKFKQMYFTIQNKLFRIQQHKYLYFVHNIHTSKLALKINFWGEVYNQLPHSINICSLKSLKRIALKVIFHSPFMKLFVYLENFESEI